MPTPAPTVTAAYLNANGITFATLADGAFEEIAAFRDFMGYTAPWYSNAHIEDATVGVAGRSCYLRRAPGRPLVPEPRCAVLVHVNRAVPLETRPVGQ